jgi:hypothetical protein
MLQTVRGRRELIVLTMALAVVALACQSDSNPTAPPAPEPSAFVTQSSPDLAPAKVWNTVPQFDLWATVMHPPVSREINDQRWVEIVGSCKASEMGPEWPAVLMCPPDLAGKCATLHQDNQVVIGCVRMDVAGRMPTYKVLSLQVTQ